MPVRIMWAGFTFGILFRPQDSLQDKKLCLGIQTECLGTKNNRQTGGPSCLTDFFLYFHTDSLNIKENNPDCRAEYLGSNTDNLQSNTGCLSSQTVLDLLTNYLDKK